MVESISKKKHLYVALFIIVLLQVLISFQGFDVCDEGFSLTFYQQIFNNPSSVEYCFVYWVTGLIGGLWYELFPSGGILWFRFLAIICNTGSFLVAYKILIPYIRQWDVLIGLSIVLFINDYGFLVFYHNQLTALLSLIIIYLLLKGFKRNNFWPFLMAGILVAITILVRLPNVTLLSFILAIPLYSIFENKGFNLRINYIGLFIAGLVLGLIFIFILLKGLGHYDIMYRSLNAIFVMGESNESSHSFSNLIIRYFGSIKRIAGVGGYFVIILGILFFIQHGLKSVKRLKSIMLLLAVCCFGLLFLGTDIYIVYVIGTLGCFSLLFGMAQAPVLKLLAFLSLAMLYVLPLGSDGAMSNSGYMCIWLGLPLALNMFSELKELRVSYTLKINEISWQIRLYEFLWMRKAFIISFILIIIFSISQNAYFDPGSRFEKNIQIKNRLARGIVTTKTRAAIINDVLVQLPKYVQKDDFLLAYDNLPMLHFLTETKPYMFNPWVWIYDPENFDSKLQRAQETIKELPIVVQQKFRTVAYFGESVDDYMEEGKPNTARYNTGRTEAMNKFLRTNAYKPVWSNDYFVIYKAE